MKLATFQIADAPPRIGAHLDGPGEGRIVDLHAAAEHFGAPTLPHDLLGVVRAGPGAQTAIAALLQRCRATSADLDAFCHAVGNVRFLPPIPNPGKIVSVGANYPAHVEEISDNQQDASVAEIGRNLGSGEYPPAFAKMTSSLTGHDSDVPYPPFTRQLDYEAELAFVIGRDPRTLPRDDWRGAIFGYMNSNDLSARDVQFREMKRGLLLLGKNFSGACPTGPWLVTDDAIEDPMHLTIECRVNGERRQREDTGRMIFSIPAILERYRDLPLVPGDIVTTGSPAGVAVGMPNPENYFLRPGDTVEVEISLLGVLRNVIC